MEIRKPSIPPGLLAVLDRQARFLTYTAAKGLYYCVMPDYRDVFVGVFGDGDNGAYEWFIWDADRKTLRTSNSGYGCIGVALCDGLVESGAERANGDLDLFLIWGKKPDASTAPAAGGIEDSKQLDTDQQAREGY